MYYPYWPVMAGTVCIDGFRALQWRRAEMSAVWQRVEHIDRVGLLAVPSLAVCQLLLAGRCPRSLATMYCVYI